MARKLTQRNRELELDRERLRAAVDEIAQSANLRFFFRDIFSSASILSPLPEGNALDTARAAGRQDLALGIIAIMESYLPALWPTLLLEDLNELHDRNKAASVERTTGGNTVRDHDTESGTGAGDEY